jgi:hypothetical protein
MLLTKNRRFLADRFPALLAELEHGEGDGRVNVHVVPSRTSYPSLRVTVDGRSLSVHSQYDPFNEAEKLIAQFKDVENYQHIFFYGLGLGYHIEALIKKYPGKPFTVIEPEPMILARFMELFSLERLTDLGLAELLLDTDSNRTAQFLSDFIASLNSKVLLVTLPSYEQIFNAKCRFFDQLFQRLLSAKVAFIQANRLYQEKWVVNAMQNFEEVLQTDNILCYREVFKGQPAIIVGAGPSLNEELENLRRIKENGLAYIFTAGSGINPLLSAGIHPDFACSYDPNNAGKVVYHKLAAEGIDHIPLLFGSCVGPEVLREYPGPKLHFITGQDPLAPFYLKPADGSDLPRTGDGLTVTFVLMALLQRMGANPIILAGQNLSFRNQQMYARGIAYYTDKEQKRYMENTASLTVESVDGGRVATTRDYQLMIADMEQLIIQSPATDFINTTQGGARIGGSRFVSLQAVIATCLLGKNITKGFVRRRGETYDLNYLSEQAEAMTRSHREFSRMIAGFEPIMKRLNGPTADPVDSLAQMGRLLKKLAANRFYQTYIKPMQATDLAFLNTALTELEKEQDQRVKTGGFSRALQVFFSKTVAAYEEVRPLYEELHRRVLGWK